MDREDARAIALLVARAPSHAAGMLLVALHALKRRPKLRADLDVGGHHIDVAVELDGRRLAVLLGRTGEHRTAADKARDEALERASWAVYRLPPERVTTRPQRAVGYVLAALHERGTTVPARQSDRPVQQPWWEYDLEGAVALELDLRAVSLEAQPANAEEM